MAVARKMSMITGRYARSVLLMPAERAGGNIVCAFTSLIVHAVHLRSSLTRGVAWFLFQIRKVRAAILSENVVLEEIFMS